MTQTLPHTPAAAWSQALQAKLMAALDAAWALIERSDDPAVIRRARDKAKAVGEIAAMARKVALIVPIPKAARHGNGDTDSRQALSAGGQDGGASVYSQPTQADHARRALEKLKGGGRARL
jgi:hypothetical protein